MDEGTALFAVSLIMGSIATVGYLIYKYSRPDAAYIKKCTEAAQPYVENIKARTIEMDKIEQHILKLNKEAQNIVLTQPINTYEKWFASYFCCCVMLVMLSVLFIYVFRIIRIWPSPLKRKVLNLKDDVWHSSVLYKNFPDFVKLHYRVMLKLDEFVAFDTHKPCTQAYFNGLYNILDEFQEALEKDDNFLFYVKIVSTRIEIIKMFEVKYWGVDRIK